MRPTTLPSCRSQNMTPCKAYKVLLRCRSKERSKDTQVWWQSRAGGLRVPPAWAGDGDAQPWPQQGEVLPWRRTPWPNSSAAAQSYSQANTASFVTEESTRLLNGWCWQARINVFTGKFVHWPPHETRSKCLESGLHLPWDPVTFRTTPVNAESVTINKEREFVCSCLVGLGFLCFLIPNCVILLLQVLQVLQLPPSSPSCFLLGQAVIFSHLFTRPLQM